MIYIEDGSKEMLPYVRAEIEPGRFPFVWWFEISSWEYDKDSGQYCWNHYYLKDGGAFSLWRTWKKAREAVAEVWMELAS